MGKKRKNAKYSSYKHFPLIQYVLYQFRFRESEKNLIVCVEHKIPSAKRTMRMCPHPRKRAGQIFNLTFCRITILNLSI